MFPNSGHCEVVAKFENLCDLVIRNLNTDYTAARMIGY